MSYKRQSSLGTDRAPRLPPQIKSWVEWNIKRISFPHSAIARPRKYGKKTSRTAGGMLRCIGQCRNVLWTSSLVNLAFLFSLYMYHAKEP